MDLQVENEAIWINWKTKSRLVVRGFLQKSGLDYFEVFAPVARHEKNQIGDCCN